MPTRATDSDVRLLVPMPAKAPTALYISAANLLVNEEVVPASASSTKPLSDQRLTLIEQYLAAHFATITEERGGLTSSSLNNTKDTYFQSKAQNGGLSSTRFGLQAIALDTTGALGKLAAPAAGKALMRTAGTGAGPGAGPGSTFGWGWDF